MVVDGFGGYSHPTALRAVRILKRGWWIILLTTVAVAGAAFYQASRQEALYSASSQVLLKYQNLASGLTGIQDLSTVYQDPQRVAQTQTQIAMSPDVANRVVEAARIPGLTPGSFLGSANVTAATDSDILNFNITYGDAETAAKLATIHAKEFIQHRRELDTASIVAARKELRGRIDGARPDAGSRARLSSRGWSRTSRRSAPWRRCRRQTPRFCVPRAAPRRSSRARNAPSCSA